MPAVRRLPVSPDPALQVNRVQAAAAVLVPAPLLAAGGVIWWGLSTPAQTDRAEHVLWLLAVAGALGMVLIVTAVALLHRYFTPLHLHPEAARWYAEQARRRAKVDRDLRERILTAQALDVTEPEQVPAGASS